MENSSVKIDSHQEKVQFHKYSPVPTEEQEDLKNDRPQDVDEIAVQSEEDEINGSNSTRENENNENDGTSIGDGDPVKSHLLIRSKKLPSCPFYWILIMHLVTLYQQYLMPHTRWCYNLIDKTKLWFWLDLMPYLRWVYNRITDLRLLKFLVFNIGFLVADIYTDINVGIEFISSGDPYWGYFTLGIVFAPWCVRLCVEVGRFFYESCLFKQWQWGRLIFHFWQLPFLHPIKNLQLFFTLMLMDTNLPGNQMLINDIIREASEAGLFEAVMESTPQLILQLTIVIRTGIISSNQMIGIIFSYLSLAFAASKMFFSQRKKSEADADPSFWALLFVFPFMCCSLLLPVSYNTIFASLSSYWPMVLILIPVPTIVAILVQFFYVKQSIVKFKKTLKDEWFSLLTSLVIVFFGKNEKNRILYGTFFCMQFFIAYIHFMVLQLLPISLDDFQNPPIFLCFEASEISDHQREQYEVLNVTNSFFGLSEIQLVNSSEQCKPLLMQCSKKQQQQLSVMVLLGVLSVVSSLCSVIFFTFNYFYIYKITKKISFGKLLFIHRSIFHDFTKGKTSQSVDISKLNISKKIIKENPEKSKVTINQPDQINGDTLVHVAFYNKSYDTLQQMFDIGCNFLIKNKNGLNVMTLLEKRCKQSEDSEEITKIQNIVARIKSKLETKLDKSLPHVWNGSFAHGAIKNDRLKMFALHSCLNGSHWNSYDTGNHNLAELLFEKLTKMETVNIPCLLKYWLLYFSKSMGGMSLLHHAISSENDEALKFLIDLGLDINAVDDEGNTALHQAAIVGHEEGAKMLIDKGAKVNAKNLMRKTPLHYAALCGHIKVMKLLLPKIVSPNEKDATGKTPLHYASKTGDTHVIKALLDYEALVNTKCNDGRTALHYSAMAGSLECVQLLIEKGLEINETDKTGNSPIHFAAKTNNDDLVKLLLQLKPNVNLRNNADNTDINLKNKDGNTPLHCAAEKGRAKNIQLLIEHGAKVNLKNKSGMTPLHLAAKIMDPKGQSSDTEASDTVLAEIHNSYGAQCVQILIDKTADVNARFGVFMVTPIDCSQTGSNTYKILKHREGRPGMGGLSRYLWVNRFLIFQLIFLFLTIFFFVLFSFWVKTN